MDEQTEEHGSSLLHDLDPEIVEFVAREIPWEYHALYERLRADPNLNEDQRQEKFSEGRGDCAVRAMERAAEKFGIPKDVLRLSCNGQNKVLLRIGRLILIQETMQTRFDAPQIADYKVELARLHGTVRQLEFDFGDGRHRSYEWSGCYLAVLLHAPAGPKFTRTHKMLGALMLGLPDADYQFWVRRVDLTDVALHGRDGEAPPPPTSPADDTPAQEDKVVVRPRRKNVRKDERS